VKRDTRRLFTAVAAIALLAVQRNAAAHHAPVEFELQGNNRVELVGELVEVAWRNPHPRFALSVGRSDGSAVWTIELRGALAHLRRSGVSGDLWVRRAHV
jgi:hypothetical protein